MKKTRYTNNKDLNKFLNKAAECGFIIDVSKHVKVLFPNGNFAFQTPATPSDFRGKIKRECDLKRAMRSPQYVT